MKSQRHSDYQLLEKLNSGQRYFITSVVCGLTALVLMPFHATFDLANIVMIFLLVVFLISVNLGRECAVFSSILCVLLFDYLFVPPRFSLAVSDPQYLVVFVVMLAVALITTQMASGLKKAAEVAYAREAQANALYDVAKNLAGALTPSQAFELVHVFLKAQFDAQSWVIESPDSALVTDAMTKDSPFGIETHIATVALTENRTINNSSLSDAGWASLYVPLKSPMRMHGVLAVALQSGKRLDAGLVEAIASLLAITLERLHYVEVAHAHQIEAHTERLRSSILSALSHDLRTPLTIFVGVADSLTRIKPEPSSQVLDAARTIHKQALRLSSLVSNLLEMARLSTGQVKLKYEWHHLQDVVGASLEHLGAALADHQIRTSIPENLPLIEIDAVLIERVLSNLLENASKYSPENSEIDVSIFEHESNLEILVRDRGNGFNPNALVNIFDLFVRGDKESHIEGYGIGLAISKVIVEAHGGTICALNHPQGGGCIQVFLNKGNPPEIDSEG
jgi:two-component system, OmpR family, sensor histidine kinase KdpD